MSDKLLREMRSHVDPINTVKFTNDGKYCMTGSDDRSVQLWNPHRDDPSKNSPEALHIKTYKGNHGYPIYDLAITKDNGKFVSCGGDKACFLVDVSTGRTLRRIQAHEQRINAIDLNEDDSVLITASYDQTVSLWDLRTNTRDPIQTLRDFSDAVTSLVHSPNTITTGCVDGFVRTYDLRVGALHADYVQDPVTHLRLGNDNRSVVVTCLGGIIRLVDLQNGVQLKEYRGHLNTRYKVEATVSSDDRHLLCGAEDGSITHWDILSGEKIRQTKNAHSKTISSLVYHPSTAPLMFITVSYDGLGKCWESAY